MTATAPDRRVRVRYRGRPVLGAYSGVSPALNDPQWNVISLPVLAYITDNPTPAAEVLVAVRNKMPEHVAINALAWLGINGLATYDERGCVWRVTR